MNFKNLIGLLSGLLFSMTTFAETYQQACRVIGEDDYVQYQIEFDSPLQANTQFSLKLTAFEDENCQIPYLRYNQYFHVTDLKSDQLNLKTYKVTYTSLSDEVSEALNMIQYCDLSDWKTHSEIAVTGKVCDDYQQLAADEMFFQIFQVQNDQLRIGELSSQQDGRSENQRPSVWDSLEFNLLKMP